MRLVGRLPFIAVLAAGCVSSAHASAPPAPWQLSVNPPTVVAGIPARFALTGESAALTPDSAAAIMIQSATVQCPATYSEVPGSLAGQEFRSFPSGDAPTFTAETSFVMGRPGHYQLCGYFGTEAAGTLNEQLEATLYRLNPVAFEVRRPAVTATLNITGPVAPQQPARINGTLTSEAPATVDVQLNRAGTPCAATTAMNASSNRLPSGVLQQYVYGDLTFSEQVTMPPLVGNYHLCTYIYRDGFAADPDLVVDSTADGAAPIVVRQQPPDPATLKIIYGDGHNGTKAVTCTFNHVVVRRGTTIVVRCPGVTGRLSVALLLRRHRKPYSVTRTLRLNARGTTTLRTRTLPRGRYKVTAKWSGFYAYQHNIAIT